MIRMKDVARYANPDPAEITKMKQAHCLIAEMSYEHTPLERGYTDKRLRIDIGTNEIQIFDIPADVKEKFTGGKGYCLRYLWDDVTPETRWDSPENAITMSPGPIAGITQYGGTGKCLLATLSPMTDIPVDCNVGGYFGPFLKFSGFDMIELVGKAREDIIIVIDGMKNTISIETAPEEHEDAHLLTEELTNEYAEDENDKKNIAVVCSGSAAKYANMAMINFSFFDPRRNVCRLKQAGRGGMGRVLADKHIKAVVCRFGPVKANLNNPADLDILFKDGLKFHREVAKLDSKQNGMRKTGTAYSIETLSDYDILPFHNYQYGGTPDAPKFGPGVFKEKYLTQGGADGCWYGCSLACAKTADHFLLKTGPYAGERVCVDGPEYESAAGLGPNCGIIDPEAILELNFYCDTYGLDTISWGTMTAFLMECWERGILNSERTGGLDLTWGNWRSSLEMMHMMAKNEGFGKIAALGAHKQKLYFAEQGWGNLKEMDSFCMEMKGMEFSEYGSKESLAQQGGFGLTNKGPQHDEAWLIWMDQVNNQIPTFADKAEALYFFPMFRTWFGLVGLCKLPWNDIAPADNAETSEPAKVPEHLQNYCDLFYGVTGKKVTEKDLIRQSERVYDFQRIFDIRMGKGLRKNDAIPYRAVGPVTEHEYLSRQERYDGQLTERAGIPKEKVAQMSTEEKMNETWKYRAGEYTKLINSVYPKRGWTLNGVPKIEYLKELGMDLPELIEIVAPLQDAEPDAGPDVI
ncbi:aldehyde ferredoxin oxidoreductase family protein [Clostridium vitabionis]|uniref:aldehyde ferredoxin oxidoreductase family protein n=1 Tax=Clostridium vitabionis TaxID=2784388 RepID=UPI001A9C1E12|nr:aldehyde ferredoxin oxidoreductase C-terminal domain-containing protein [Clostridium vitabionis]